ncbi:hypothetical protein BGZ83_007256 [Gryganskiella cystojenkinii]|nr:hypothetical protein BGZ83_007256 [Gryganskiella cystojenkinii]
MDEPVIIQQIGLYLYPGDLPQYFRPSTQALDRYAQHIRSLHIDLEDTRRLNLYLNRPSVKCNNLTQLGLAFSGDKKEVKLALALVKLNPKGLQKFHAMADGEYQCRVPWKQILDHCPDLKELWLQHISLSKLDLQHITAAGPRLEVLKLESCELDEDAKLPKEPVGGSDLCQNLKHVSIDGIFGKNDMYKWIQKRTHLEILEWKSIGRSQHEFSDDEDEGDSGDRYDRNDRYDDDEDDDAGPKPKVAFAQVIRAPIWSKVHSLTLTSKRYGLLSDSSLALILESCAPLRKIVVPKSHAWHRFFDALDRRHFATLEKVDLSNCKSIRSWMIQKMLTSCPRLTEFKATEIPANELVVGPQGAARRKSYRMHTDDGEDEERKVEEDEDDDFEPVPLDPEILGRYKAARDDAADQVQPWVCRGLRVLQLGINGVDPEWNVQVFEQLGKMTRLESLDVGFRGQYTVDDALDFRLQSGLDRLAPLKDLQCLYFHGTRQQMEAVDVLWITKQWPKLRELSRNFHHDYTTKKGLDKLVHID